MKYIVQITIQMLILLIIIFVVSLADLPEGIKWYDNGVVFMKNLQAFLPGFIVILGVNIHKIYKESNKQ